MFYLKVLDFEAEFPTFYEMFKAFFEKFIEFKKKGKMNIRVLKIQVSFECECDGKKISMPYYDAFDFADALGIWKESDSEYKKTLHEIEEKERASEEFFHLAFSTSSEKKFSNFMRDFREAIEVFGIKEASEYMLFNYEDSY